MIMKKLLITIIAFCLVVTMFGCEDFIKDFLSEDSNSEVMADDLTDSEEKILQALTIACESGELTNDDIDMSTVKIVDVSSIYNFNVIEYTADFCIMQIEFNKLGDNKKQSMLFVLIVSDDGTYNRYPAYLGQVPDKSLPADSVSEYVTVMKDFWKEIGGEMKNKKNALLISVDKMNKFWSQEWSEKSTESEDVSVEEITSQQYENSEENSHTTSSNTIVSSCNKSGQINCHSGTVAGFTTEYVVEGGVVGKVRSSLGDKWHVTAYNTCTSMGIVWYELYDTNDGDYYGWVDSDYIDFY